MIANTHIGSDVVAKKLLETLGSRLKNIERYAPRCWWECDVFSLTQSCYWYEYEIKCSKSDFYRDKNKYSGWWASRPDAEGCPSNKHEAIRAGFGPSRFCFVCPEGVLDGCAIPDFAGLIEVGESVVTKIKAPRIHNEPISYRRLKHIVASWHVNDRPLSADTENIASSLEQLAFHAAHDNWPHAETSRIAARDLDSAAAMLRRTVEREEGAS